MMLCIYDNKNGAVVAVIVW